MATDRQFAANRLNALRSRGPRTVDGRAASRRNALKHGLTARSLMIDGEDPNRFEELRAELFDAYRPQGIVDAQLIDMMAGILWRLQRVPALEAAAFSWMQCCHRHHGLVGSDSAPVTNGVRRIRPMQNRKSRTSAAPCSIWCGWRPSRQAEPLRSPAVESTHPDFLRAREAAKRTQSPYGHNSSRRRIAFPRLVLAPRVSLDGHRNDRGIHDLATTGKVAF